MNSALAFVVTGLSAVVLSGSVVLSSSVVLSGCGSVSLHGGRSLAEGKPPLPVERAYRVEACIDDRGTTVTPPALRVLSMTGHRRTVLVTRPGRESWWIDRAARDDDDVGARLLHFQLSLVGGDGGDLLVDVRLRPEDGRMAWVREYEESVSEHGLRAHFERAEITCELVLESGPAVAASKSPLADRPDPVPEVPAESTDPTP